MVSGTSSRASHRAVSEVPLTSSVGGEVQRSAPGLPTFGRVSHDTHLIHDRAIVHERNSVVGHIDHEQDVGPQIVTPVAAPGSPDETKA
jgi:hypothetical protein